MNPTYQTTTAPLPSLQEYLAELGEVRAKGWAFESNAVTEGISCIGVPLRDYSGNVVAALSISGNTNTILAENIEQLAGHAKETASLIAGQLK